MTSQREQPVIVVGGGIGGLTVAIALARKGIPVRLLEQADRFEAIGAGIQLGPNAFKMLGLLGVADAVRELAVFPEATIVLDSVTGKQIVYASYGADFVQRFKMAYTVIHRADLHSALVGACAKSNLIRLETSIKVVDVEEIADGVALKAEDGRTITGAALIGADGLWSTIRAKILNDGKPRVSGHVCYRAVLPTSEVPEEMRIRAVRVWAGEKVHLVIYPLRGGDLFNLGAVFQSDRFTEGWDSFGDVNELQERFSATCQDVRTLLDKIETWRMWALCDREPVRVWSRVRSTLLGDAAHPTLQYLAQGAAMAIEDAVCVADEIVKCDGDYATAFQKYQDRRYLRTGRVQLMSRIYGDAFHASGVAREIRNQLLGGYAPLEGYAWLYDYDG